MPNIGGMEMFIILLVVLLLFGSAKLPQLARSLGKSARILKAETKGLHGDDEQPAQPQPAQQTQAAPPQPAPQQQPYQQGQLPSGEPIQGVPVSDPKRRSS